MVKKVTYKIEYINVLDVANKLNLSKFKLPSNKVFNKIYK